MIGDMNIPSTLVKCNDLHINFAMEILNLKG